MKPITIKNTLFLLGLLFLGLSEYALAAETSYEVIATNIGAESENTKALRDKYGFLWVGSTEGINAYDGNGLAVYDNHSNALRELGGNKVTSLLEKDDNIWIGSANGLYVFDRSKNRITRFPETTPYGVNISSEIRKTEDAGNGKIWIATLGQGFFIYDLKTGQLTQNSRHGSFYSDIAVGADGLVYLVTLAGDVQSFSPEGKPVKTFKLPDFVNDKNPILMVSSGKDIWVGSGSSFYRVDPENGTIKHISTGNLRGNINTIIRRADGTLLLTTDLGVWSYSTVKDTISEIKQSRFQQLAPESRLRGVAEDSDDNIILIYERGPLDLMITKDIAVNFIPLEEGENKFPAKTVNAISPGKHSDGIWIGTDDGLTYYNFRTGNYGIPRNIIPTDLNITSIHNDDDNVFVGTNDKGLYILDKKTMEARHYMYDEKQPYSLVSNKINKIAVTEKGDVLILTDWGVCQYNPEERNFRQLTEFSHQTNTVAYEIDKEGVEWIATTNNGLHSRRPGEEQFERAYWTNELDRIPVTMLTVGKEGTIWAASPKDGVFVFDKASNQFRKLTLPVLDKTTVMFITTDNSGQTWIGTDKNLIQADASDRNHRYFNFSRHAAHYPIGGSVILLPTGTVAIGAHNGFLLFDPSKLKPYEIQTKAFPLSISLPFMENDSIERNNLGLDRLLYMQDKIELPYRDNTFTINLASSRPFIESDVRYDYMLKGADKTWNIGTSIPQVTYNNLAPGTYEFLLKPHGSSSSEVSTLKISILPPWYRTWWAYLIYILLLIFAVVASYFLTQRLVSRNFRKKLREMEIQKERETFEAKTKYFVDLVHEIRTPLMLISLPLEQLTEHTETKNKNEAETDEANRVYLKSMQQNLDYLLGITNQLLDFRKAEKNAELHLNFSRCDVNALLMTICERFIQPLKVEGKTLETEMPETSVYAIIDTDKMERLLVNLIGNAMKYCRQQIKVTLTILDNEEVRITVSDDGPGIPQKERKNIFDPYYQIGNDKVAATLGTGLGLAYAKLIADAHHGTISVDSSNAGGALFTLTFPEGKDIPLANPIEDVEFEEENPVSMETANEEVTVMLVEDNDSLRKLITDSLGKRFTVVSASDGEEALELLKDNGADIIVSDMMMERMNGIELCKQVKGNVELSHIPFILLTAMTSREAHEEGLSSGADVYLEKPFPMKQLILQIDNLLKTRRLFKEFIGANAGEKAEDILRSPKGKRLNKLDIEFIDKMNEFISNSIDNEEFSIDGLAQSLNMSRSSFYRKITAVTGMSPNEYLKNFRLNYAAKLLKEGGRVSEVSSSVGFTSSSYFAKCFKEKFGVLPSDYVDSLDSQQKSENC